MNLVKVKDTFFKECKSQGADPYNQLLHNEAGRPCVLVVKLKLNKIAARWPAKAVAQFFFL